jgi:hypothetical protein
VLLDDVGHDALGGDRGPVDVFRRAAEYQGDPVDLILAERRGLCDQLFALVGVAVVAPLAAWRSRSRRSTPIKPPLARRMTANGETTTICETLGKPMARLPRRRVWHGRGHGLSNGFA